MDRWLHRFRCVYCGRRTDEPHPFDAGRYAPAHEGPAKDVYPRTRAYYRRHPLTCWRHVSLLASDPVYALDDRQRVKGKGSR